MKTFNLNFTEKAKYSIVVLNAILFSLLITGCSILIPKEIRELEQLEIFAVAENGEAIVLDGVINSSALDQFKVLASEYPGIKRIEIVNCDGSINDEVNLVLAKYVYDNQYDIHLLDNGLVASGGTDLFLAGHKRSKGASTKIGVHSWAGGNKTATDFPVGHANHLPYIDYYVSIGFTEQQAETFYYFTINAAPANDIHWMTETEISQYNLISK